MARQRSDADNLRAGLFVLASLVAALVVVLVLAGVGDRLKRRTRYTVYFPLGSDPTGLEIDSQVIVNGRPVGVVDKIDLELEPANSRPDGTYFGILVDRRIRFYGSPLAYLNRPLLGAGATLNFPTIGEVGAAAVAPAGSIFEGAIAPPSFLAQAGYGPEQQAQVREILARGSRSVAELEAMITQFRSTTYPQLTGMVGNAHTRLGEWFDVGDRVASNVDAAAARFPAIVDSVDQAVEEARRVVASAQGAFDENRPGFRETIENAKTATQRLADLVDSLQTNTRPTIDAMLADAAVAVERARTTAERADALLAESSPALRRTVANARLASDQLKFTLEEVRRAPWRLLYRPDTRELEFELLYDAARVYAQAVSDLRDASASLEAAAGATRGPDGSALAPARAEALHARLDEAFGAYKEAERAFLDLIIRHDAQP